MVGKCILAPDINKCSFFIVEKEGPASFLMYTDNPFDI